MLRFLTAGESHGPSLVAIVEGLPAGLPLTPENVNRDLRRRQRGYGRSARQQIEQDQAEVLGGLVDGCTIGSPLALRIRNRDWENWRDREIPPWTVPRPGHADLAGGIKYALDDLRLVAERASARETAARVAVGAVAKRLLSEFDIAVGSYVAEIGGVEAEVPELPLEELWARGEESDVRCPHEPSAERMRSRIDQAKKAGDTLGGVIVAAAIGLPVGLGSHVHWDRRLDARLAWAVMSIPAIKGVEIGPAFENARRPGTQVHDEISPPISHSLPVRRSNRAGGFEGGITNGQPILVRAAMKPISTTLTPLRSVDLATGEPAETRYTRSDVCAVPAAAVVTEAMVAWVLAQALMEKIGGDSLDEMHAHWRAWQEGADSGP
ncbi:MAG: chorismate synthase [Chloroflexota bacterium]|nr:chorismate synthase [Chloroflexota bacterium]